MHVYLAVEIHEDGRVEPSVSVMSTSPGAYMAGGSGMPLQPGLDVVRLGTKITGEVLDFAESLKREEWEVAG